MLPKNLRYQTKADPSQARQYISHIQPQNAQDFAVSGQTVQFFIPTGRNLCLNGAESYLHCDVAVVGNATAGTYFRWAGAGVQSLIQRLRVYWGGVLLEDIDNYNLLVAKLTALQSSGDNIYGKQSIMGGMTSNHLVQTYTTSAAGNYADNVAYLGQTSQQICGERWNTFGAAVVANYAATKSYAFPLLSSILGTLSDKYAPLFRMSGSSLRMEIQFVSAPQKAFVTSHAVVSATVKNFEFVANYIELSDAALAIIEQSLAGQDLMYVVPQYRSFVDTKSIASAATTTVNVSVPARFSSLKALLTFPRDKADGAVAYDSLSTCHYGLSTYSWRLGGEVVPSKQPASYPEHLMELIKTVDCISNLYHSPVLNEAVYSAEYYVPANSETRYTLGSATKTCQYGIGLDCEIYSNADKESLFSGLNSQGMDIYLQATHVVGADGLGAGVASMNVRYDTFAMYDAVVVCRADGMVELRT